MLTIEQARKALGREFLNLTDMEIEQIINDMFNFWDMMLEE